MKHLLTFINIIVNFHIYYIYIFRGTRDPYSTGVKRAAGKSTGVGTFRAITVDLRCPQGRLGVGPAGPRPLI